MIAPRLTYTPATVASGGLCVLIGPDFVLAMGPESHGHLSALWDLIASEGGGSDSVFEYVMGVGLRSFPTLVIANCRPEPDGLDVILRGDVSVVTQHHDGTTARHTGAGARTWRKVELNAVAVLRIHESTEPTWLPIRSGAVLAESVVWELNGEERADHTRLVPAAPEPGTTPAIPVASSVPVVAPEPVTPDAHARPLAASASPGAEEAVLAQPIVEYSDGDSLHSVEPVDPVDAVASVDPVDPDDLVVAPVVSPAAAVAPEAAVAGPSRSLIGSVPISEVPGSTSSLAAADGLSEEDSAAEDQDQFDRIFGVTRQGSVEDAAVRAAATADVVGSRGLSDPAGGGGTASAGAPVTADAGAGSAELGDRDGMTISREELESMKQQTAGGQHSGQTPRGCTMRAIVCPAGHPNPTHQERCRVCAAVIIDRGVRDVPEVAPGVLVFADGQSEVLDGPMVIGRQPRETGMTGQVAPRLVSVPSPEKLLSRSHIAVRVEGWSVTVTDLGTGNGTEVTLPGEGPQRLRGGQPCLIVPGTVVELAGEAVMTYEVRP